MEKINKEKDRIQKLLTQRANTYNEMKDEDYSRINKDHIDHLKNNLNSFGMKLNQVGIGTEPDGSIKRNTDGTYDIRVSSEGIDDLLKNAESSSQGEGKNKK